MDMHEEGEGLEKTDEGRDWGGGGADPFLVLKWVVC